MPVYNQAINRSDLGGSDSGIIPVEYANEIIKNSPKSSVLLTRGRRVTMSSKERTQPVLNMFPAAYWVNGDTGMKQTTKAMWKGLKMTAEELAVIIPVPDAIIEDASINLWDEITPNISEAFGIAIDQAGIFGAGKPDSWPTAIVPGAKAAGNVVTAGTGVDLADDIAAMGETLAGQGYNLNAFASMPGLNWKLRRLRSSDNEPIYQNQLDATGTSGIYGMPLNEVDNGAWDATQALMLGGDFSNFLVGMRQDITYKWLTEAVISDDDGKVILNLAQQDCTALRVVMRVGFQIANPINRIQPDETKRFPAVVLAPAAVSGESGAETASGEAVEKAAEAPAKAAKKSAKAAK